MSSASTRGAPLAWAFFIDSAFATSRCPGADETQAVTALGKHDRKEAIGLGEPQQGQPELARRVARIINYDAEGITEGRSRLVEGGSRHGLSRAAIVHPPVVPRCLLRCLHGHAFIRSVDPQVFELLHRSIVKRVPGRPPRHEVSPVRSPIYGRMFWFSRKKFVGSCLRLSARSRSYLASP